MADPAHRRRRPKVSRLNAVHVGEGGAPLGVRVTAVRAGQHGIR
jgi:hypothetical protein